MKICIIPARSGSKRIKNKNIKKFDGKPIIGTVLKNLKKMKFFEKIIVTTDQKKNCKNIKEIWSRFDYLQR